MSPVGFADLRIRDLSQRITGHSDLVLFHFVRNTVTGSAGVLHVTLDDDDDVVGVDEDPMMRTAPQHLHNSRLAVARPLGLGGTLFVG
jgi:hypothetical protein